ncbi:heptaprenyl diphosphate synthase component II [Terrilactibacillus sp. BCM23-1]|uniref:Heptaprenyl diphosphate synthase component II n=1 Tax=Terrilactibacillus tamarindi TaxID=2599694 RepID=A0A6N8CMV8_9BACI|nr:heptaprenyl diphosphate synthase component II [Terrilactibacillus tamarindi]MTT31271.1 heptaprenyl diphosphate synthase component II [Terrilactibacillus tamarindi]
MTIAGIYRTQKRNLKEIEQVMENLLKTNHTTLHQAAVDLLRAGGKRIRPILVMLSAEFGNPNHEDVKKAAVTLELIHMASLVHDDVVDNANLRRGKKTVKATWDNRVAMYTGDYIFAHSIEHMTGVHLPYAHQLVSKAIRDISLGEIEQIRHLYNVDQHLRHYLLRIKRKTALLIALSCQLGALTAGCSHDIVRKLYYFGYFIGMSYQIIDDILDFVGTEKQLGKPAGSDLKQGNITLPTLFALSIPDVRQRVVSCFESNNEQADWDGAIQLVKQSGGIEYAESINERYLAKALNILKSLPQNQVTENLRKIAKYLGKRKY